MDLIRKNKMTHYLLKNEQDRWLMCWKYIQAKLRGDNVWKEEDLKKIQPFFDWHDSKLTNNRAMTQIESEAYDYYQDVFHSYALELFELRDLVEDFSLEDIFRIFSYKWDENYFYDKNGFFDIDDNQKEPINEKSVFTSLIEIHYPCVAVVYLGGTYDRLDETSIVVVDYVELREFEK
jgi:hypothetical protein